MNDPINVAKLANEVEAGLMGSILTEQDIPHIIHSYYDAAFDGVVQVVKGWGVIEAPEEYAEQIKTILKEVREEAASHNEDDIDE